MTDQEVFDKVCAALIVQGVPSRDDETDSCRYRGPNGTKCAVGHMIPDHMYSEKIEGDAVPFADADNYINRTPVAYLLKSLGFARNFKVLANLQGDHDAAANHPVDQFVEKFKHNARMTAFDLGLNSDILET